MKKNIFTIIVLILLVVISTIIYKNIGQNNNNINNTNTSSDIPTEIGESIQGTTSNGEAGIQEVSGSGVTEENPLNI